MSVSPFHLQWDFQCFGCCWLFSGLLFWWGGFVVCVALLVDWFSPPFCIRDAQGRRHSQDCHHRHDERSSGAKKKGNHWK